MANKAHTVSSARADLADALNAAEGVRDIKVGKGALSKLIGQAEELLEADEKVEFGAYYYERGLTMVTYYLVLATDRRVLRVNRTTWKLKPYTCDRAGITGVDVAGTSPWPRVTIHLGEAKVAPFSLVRSDAERLRDLLAPSAV